MGLHINARMDKGVGMQALMIIFMRITKGGSFLFIAKSRTIAFFAAAAGGEQDH